MLLPLALPIAQAPQGLAIDVRYPRFSAGGPVSRAANAEAAARERRETSRFRAQYRKDLPELRKDGVADRGYQLSITPHRITDRAGLASGYVETYGYLAGAHGSTGYDAINVGRVRGRVRPLGLRDLFRPGEDATGQSSRALLAILKAEKEPMGWVASGEWKGLTKDEVDHFVVGRLGVLVLFGSYELGPFSDGTRTVLVPYAKLPGLDRSGVLATFLR